jgi:hypothetical protein
LSMDDRQLFMTEQEWEEIKEAVAARKREAG